MGKVTRVETVVPLRQGGRSLLTIETSSRLILFSTFLGIDSVVTGFDPNISHVNGQGWQFENYHPNPNVRNNQHLFSYKTNPNNPNDRSQGNPFQNPGYQKPYPQNQNGKMFILSQAQNQFQNRQNNPQAAPAAANGPPDELKGMMQQLLQEGEQPPFEDVLDDEQDAEQPTVIDPIALTTQDQPVPTRVYTPKVPYPVSAKRSRKDCEKMKCKKMPEKLNVKLSLMDAIQMIPSMCSLVKGLISGKTSADNDIMMVSKECSAVLQNRTNTCNVDADGYEKILDSSKSIEKMVTFLSLGHVVHPSVDVCRNLIQCLAMNLHTLQQLLHHHTQTLQLIWLTIPGSWNSLPIALPLSLVLVLNLPGCSFLHAEDVPLVVFQ
ncbi:hypothetical protein F2Q68_00021006 [Brassica cretica]|uniref:Uncharacterized protein n=1 Tax=Brassica cretica TaxID=69181 RepID=A0A8S9FTK9_BRACR|nr:hypothetical protein F2Q68_00021006 [Brassica cretica]